ncbi:Tm-1-like ATP-binding domain-containing protein, partial [bacterium]|nr:Tm-1-like ATP-binding domain-containing protein [bacterium]
DDHQIVWHSPYVFVPRLLADEQARVAKAIGERLQHTTGNALFLMPLKGVSSYSAEGGALYNPELDAAYWESLQRALPSAVKAEALDLTAEDPAFVDYAVDKLIELINK